MNATFDACLRSWPLTPWLDAGLLITAGIYLAGWWKLHRRDPARWPVNRLAAFLCGLLTVFLALASPIETFSSFLLQIHMLQHLLLMIVVPPLIWRGCPQFPLLIGLPAPIRTVWVEPLARSRSVHRLTEFLTFPPTAWIIYVAITWIWHIPPSYELGLANNTWHIVQHLCFLGGGLLFWYPIMQPYPSSPRWGQWMLFPYLLLADLQNTVLAAWLTFSSRVLYPHYEQVPRLGGISALDDQHIAGVLMWVPGSIAFLVPLFWLGVKFLLSPRRQSHRSQELLTPQPTLPLHSSVATRPDLLMTPGLGDLLNSRITRRIFQMALLVAAILLVVDGLLGPQIAPMNLAGVVPWIHWRGVLILTLLVAGNFFCMVCPFTLPRWLAGRTFRSQRSWPRPLRSKWLATGLVVLFLWSYEAFALWDSPWITAWIIVGYFLAAFVIESFFTGASFCKYVCPIGQFNFVQSMVSPLQVAVRDSQQCVTCTTHDCLRGNETAPGCTMGLFQPTKTSNMDCTFCLDCVRACPQENVGVLVTLPGQSLWKPSAAGKVSSWLTRTDVAALALLFIFGAFVNAAGMTAPLLEWEDSIQSRLGNPPRWLIVTLAYLVGLFMVPALLVAAAGTISRIWGGLSQSSLQTATRFLFALIPVSFGMWLAHYSFHFFTSWETVIPATQRFAADFGFLTVGTPQWQCACCRPPADWITHAEIVMLDLGLLLSMYAGYRIAEQEATTWRRALQAWLPWAGLTMLLFAAGVWIVLQPMEMRGTLPAPGEYDLSATP